MFQRHFAEMWLLELSGTIAVADSEPVVAHLASYHPWAKKHEQTFDAVIRRVRERVVTIIEREGAFRISSRGGIFVCRGRGQLPSRNNVVGESAAKRRTLEAQR